MKTRKNGTFFVSQKSPISEKINNLFGVLLIGVLLMPIFVLANGDHEHEIEEGRELVESKVSCDTLTDEQLEAIGEYYMEQMHPGEAHEAMDEMMGGEGSESLRNMHIQMARNMYCGEGGMMGSGGMMGGGMMMPMMRNMMGGNTMGSGMMGNYPMGYSYWSFWNIIWILFWVGIILLIFWLIYKFIIQKRTENPLEILKKRFAKGEINKKQFEEMKKELGE